MLLFYSSFFLCSTTGRAASAPLSLHRLCLLSLRLCLLPYVSACLVGCCIVVMCLVVCVVLLRHSVTSPRHVALHYVVKSCRHDTSSCRRVVLSRLASLLRCALLRILSDHIVWLVVASSRWRCISSLLPLAVATCYCITRCCCRVASRHHVPSRCFLLPGLV